MTAVRKTDSVATVGDVVSCLVQSPRCLRPSAQKRALIDSSRFSFRNISDETAFFFSSAERLSLCTGVKTDMLCICSNSLVTPSSPRSLNFLRPAPTEYCWRITPNAYSSLSSTGIGAASLRSESEKNTKPSRRRARFGPPRAVRRACMRRP